MPLYTKLKYNATALGKRFIHKSAPKMSKKPSSVMNPIVQHHPLYARQDSYDDDK